MTLIVLLLCVGIPPAVAGGASMLFKPVILGNIIICQMVMDEGNHRRTKKHKVLGSKAGRKMIRRRRTNVNTVFHQLGKTYIRRA